MCMTDLLMLTIIQNYIAQVSVLSIDIHLIMLLRTGVSSLSLSVAVSSSYSIMEEILTA